MCVYLFKRRKKESENEMVIQNEVLILHNLNRRHV